MSLIDSLTRGSSVAAVYNIQLFELLQSKKPTLDAKDLLVKIRGLQFIIKISPLLFKKRLYIMKKKVTVKNITVEVTLLFRDMTNCKCMLMYLVTELFDDFNYSFNLQKRHYPINNYINPCSHRGFSHGSSCGFCLYSMSKFT